MHRDFENQGLAMWAIASFAAKMYVKQESLINAIAKEAANNIAHQLQQKQILAKISWKTIGQQKFQIEVEIFRKFFTKQISRLRAQISSKFLGRQHPPKFLKEFLESLI